MKQAAVVAEQFGNTASAYLTSTVHAHGADLDAVKEVARSFKAPAVLDLGCGGGHISFAMAPFAATVTACDLSDQMLAVVAASAAQRELSNIETEQAQAEKLPFADASFDIVITRFSAHHWLHVPTGLREMHRVLRPNGIVIVIDIVASEIALHDTTLQAVELLRDASHVRDYRVSEWSAMFTAAGFAHEYVNGWKLKMVFDEWIARMRTPSERVTAIRSLFDSAPEETHAYFDVQDDYSFYIDAAFFTAIKIAA